MEHALAFLFSRRYLQAMEKVLQIMRGPPLHEISYTCIEIFVRNFWSEYLEAGIMKFTIAKA